MQIEQILAERKRSVDSKLLVVNSNLSTDSSKLITDVEIDFCLEQTNDLVNEQFRSWYILRMMKLGCAEYMERADKARKYGKDPKKYFSSILKRG